MQKAGEKRTTICGSGKRMKKKEEISAWLRFPTLAGVSELTWHTAWPCNLPTAIETAKCECKWGLKSRNSGVVSDAGTFFP